MPPMGLLATKSFASIAGTFLSFISECMFVCFHAKYYFSTIYIPITQTVGHYNGQPLLEIMPNTISESLYFGVRPYICPILALYFHCTSLISSPIF